VTEGFGFTDSAFCIFNLMASRLLNSDRFFATVYNANVDRPAQAFPELLPSLRNVKNAFAPWQRTGNPPSLDHEKKPQ
jgi:hypothetical protein